MSLTFDLTDTIYKFVSAIESGEADEIVCYGPWGDGKTQGALIGMILHAVKHKESGFPLPVTWMGVTDTFESHKSKTVPSLLEPHWEGRWKLSEGKHVAAYYLGKVPLVRLNLFGIEDQGALDRVRRAAVGMWFEEAAPASLLVKSSGVGDSAWSTGLTSLRTPSHCNPAILTENYPDEDHWSWKHWHMTEEEIAEAGMQSPEGNGIKGVHPKFPRRMWFRVPPGERASKSQRQKWMDALRDRPDLQRRLLEGRPGTVMLGVQVAQGFDEDKHVSTERIRPIEGEPLFVALDFGHTPACIIGQSWRGYLRVNAALPCPRGGIRQHIENAVIPWLANNARWALGSREMILGCYDPAGDTPEQADIDQSPMRVVEDLLPGQWDPGPVSWDGRKGPMLASFNRHVAPGEPALQIDPVDGKPLIQALSGRWYYPQDRGGNVSRDLPKKPNHPWEDLGDAYCYWLARVLPEQKEAAPLRVDSSFDVFSQSQITVESDFDVR